MAAVSLQDQVSALLSRKVVEDRNNGRQSVDLEAAAIIENFATTLLLNPKVVLYFANLAKNGLLAALQSEVDAIDALVQTIQDLGNQTFAIKSTSALERAKTALLQLENQNISSVGSAYSRFDSAVSDFLGKQLKKNVLQPGATSLVRPGVEARQDMPSAYSDLVSAHAGTLNRLFALAVGVQNFESTPLSTIIGGALAYEARTDIQGIIDSIGDDPSGAQSRDFATRLIASRAALKSVVTPPSITDPSLSTSQSLPVGYALSAHSELLPASMSFGPDPGTGLFAQGGDLNISVDGVLTNTTPNLGLGPVVVGAPGVSWPVTVPPNTHLFLSVDGVPHRVPLNDGTDGSLSMSILDVIHAIEDVGLNAGEFGKSGSGRLMLWRDATKTRISVDPVGVGDPVGVFNLGFSYSNSAHALLGLQLGVFHGATADMVVDAVNLLVPSVTASKAALGKVSVSAKSPIFGNTMVVSGTLADKWGASGTYVPTSSVLTLVGKTPDGSAPNPVLLLSPGDLVATPVGSSTIASLNSSFVILSSPVTTFSGPVTITSGLLLSWQSSNQAIQAFLSKWASSPFLLGLGRLDALIAVLAGSATPAQRSQTLSIVGSLSEWVSSLVAILSAPASQLPAGGAALEGPIAENLLATLLERKYDQAADLLVMCRVSEFFDLDYQTMSYGGALMKASADFAQTDVLFPNRANDDDVTVTHRNQGAGA